MKLSKQASKQASKKYNAMKTLQKRFSGYFLGAALTSIASTVSFSASAQDNSLTVISWGGAYNIMQKKYVVDPFERDTGTRILFDGYAGGMAEIKAQVEAGKVQWDVVNVDGFTLERACSEGLLEILDHNILSPGSDGSKATDDFFPGTLTDCGIANDIYSLAIGYNTNTIGNVVPKTIADVFDTQKIPGKRGFQRKPINLLEWALLADGVAREHVYHELATEAGQNRAFSKLDSIKKDIVWFDAYSQAPQLLNDGGAIMVQAPHGRFYEAIRNQNSPFVILWDGHVYDYDIWSIPKGTPKLELAKRFVTFATESAPLVGGTDLSYSPTRKSSLALVEMDDLLRNNLPTSHLNIGIQANAEFWADYGQALDERFAEWLLAN